MHRATTSLRLPVAAPAARPVHRAEAFVPGGGARALFACASLLVAACSGTGKPMGTDGGTGPAAAVSSTIALTADDATLWAVNPESDSVSVVDVTARHLVAEIPLGTAPPAVDPVTGRFDPKVRPRALALVGTAKVYVAGQASGSVHVVSTATRAVTGTIPVGAEPIAVVASSDGSVAYVVDHQAGTVSRIDATRDQVTATLDVGDHPFGATLSADGKTLYVTRLLLEAGATVVDTASFTVRARLPLAEQPVDKGGKLVPNGLARGVYTVVPRPGSGELWIPHLLLAVATAQPQLDFQSTVFPTISTVTAASAGTATLVEGRRLLFKPGMVPSARGAFIDSVSGPRALAFTPDGALALLLDSASEDVMIFDAQTGTEKSLLRPIPSTFPEGIVVDHGGRHAFLAGRNSHDLTVLAIDPSDEISPVKVDGPPIDLLAAADPMPANLRRGQRLFYTANIAAFPITQNYWVACASCHLEGGSDAVTWRFAQGPRDTPSNAGGMLQTGFLMRQALRNTVDQYDETIRIEQGGHFDQADPGQKALLDELTAFVNLSIPLPRNPYLAANGVLTDAQARGKVTFDKLCGSCHDGPMLTDSGEGNPTLDLAGTVVLHDVGTCAQGTAFDDQPKPDYQNTDGKLRPDRTACDFDTPTLRGIFSTAPYLHDGSAATLADVLDRFPFSTHLPAADKTDLVRYLETL